MIIKTPIIPVRQTFYGECKTLDREAICVFAATGFFLDQDTYYKELKILKPAHSYTLDEARNSAIEEKAYFKWNYQPREISLKDATHEFAELFEKIIDEQIGNRKVILPLSGGLDSRTQAAALKVLGNEVNAYSYSFENGHDEAEYGKRIAEVCDYPYENWKVPVGYLWNSIERLAKINGCYSEFTHPRQMAFIDRYENMGDVFSLGHWGDVLFDSMGVADNLTFDEQLHVVLKKILKKGGKELGHTLWQVWGLTGDFDEYLTERVRTLLTAIDIPNSANAHIRAFKSLHWAPRWTSVNLSVFESAMPITLPYYDNRMCQFICTIPEKHLAKRQIQIEYLKLRNPKLARIPWQEHRPFNLYNYNWDKTPYNLPYRIGNKLNRLVSNKNLVQRNWELQFCGEENDRQLKHYLFDDPAFLNLIPKEVIQKFYSNFKQNDPVRYSHSVSMLLTIALFVQRNLNLPHSS
jgi:hypothetical protein